MTRDEQREAAMPTYWVWDESEGEDTARKIKAREPHEAALRFAESDVDGIAHGTYETGCVICVHDGQFRTHRITVTVDYDTTFHTETAPDPEVLP